MNKNNKEFKADYYKDKILNMKIIEIDKETNACRFCYWSWRKFKFEYSCWAKNVNDLFGKTKNQKHFALMIYR